MLTGYTVNIEDEKITSGKEFLILCSREFGIETDSQASEETIDYYKLRYEAAKEDLEYVKSLNLKDTVGMFRSMYESRVEKAKQALKKMEINQKRYIEIRSQIEKWNPPTPEHEKLKNFALEQIAMSMDSEDIFKYYRDIIDKPFDDSDEAISSAHKDYVSWLTNNMKNAKADMEKENEKIKKSAEFMKKFFDSFKDTSQGE